MRNFPLFLAAILLAAGCSRQSAPPAQQSNAEIERAIQDHLSKRSGLSSSSMITEVKAVRIQGDKAEADVFFRSKSNPEASMTMTYVLKRTGNTWAVEGGKSGSGGGTAHPDTSQPGAGAPHGEMGGAPNPHAMPPAGKPK